MDEEKNFDPYVIDEYLFDLQAESPATRLQAFQKLPATYVPPVEGRAVRVRQSASRRQREVELLPETFMERQIVRFLAFYQKRPRLTALLSLVFLLAVASTFIYSIMPRKQSRVLPTNRHWLAAATGNKTGSRSMGTRPVRSQVMSIRGVVSHLDDLRAYVTTNSAVYQLSFLDNLPEGCVKGAKVEARGRYAGYCYASRSVKLNCEKFYAHSLGKAGKDR